MCKALYVGVIIAWGAFSYSIEDAVLQDLRILWM